MKKSVSEDLGQLLRLRRCLTPVALVHFLHASVTLLAKDQQCFPGSSQNSKLPYQTFCFDTSDRVTGACRYRDPLFR